MNFLERQRKKFDDYLYDPSIYIKDRTFVLFTVCELSALLVYSVISAFLGDDILSVFVSLAGLLLGFGVLYYFSTRGRINTAKVVISLLLVLLLRPAAFITKGGLDYGITLMLLLGGYYLMLILDGKFRIVMCLLDTGILLACGVFIYYHPELLPVYSKEKDYILSGANYIIAFSVLTVLITFWTKILQKQASIAEEKSKELEELNRSQNRFFSSMSHEIRTPINTVLGLNEIILRQEDASEEIKKDARNIQGAGKLLLALINDILDVSKIEAGKMDIVPVNYSVASLLSEIVNMIWLKADEKGLKFNVDIDPDVPETLFGDEVRIKQILINLLNNAVKYTSEGAVSLRIECDDSENEGVLLKITVEDTGMGIKPEALPHLFDTFHRVDEEKNRYIEGTGLGLSIVKQLVGLMDGEIKVNSVYTKGTTFVVSLMQGVSSEKRVGDIRITNSGRLSDTDKFEHSFHAPDARVLIVDDNEMNLEVERKLIEGTGIVIDLAHSGTEALTGTVQNRYDVIFMDHLMPEMDGIECFEHIRRQSGGLNHHTPIIVLTANAGGDNIELYNNAGFDGYLLKPVSGKALEDTLITHLPQDKIIRRGSNEMTGSRISTASGYKKKKPIALCCSTMTDIPKEVLTELEIATIPFEVITEEGVFWDNVDMDADELIRYMDATDSYVDSMAPSTEELIRFFSEQLEYAHHIIYITLATGISVENAFATEAAKTFENVTVFNSGSLSSASGILVMIAGRLIQQNLPVDRIVAELEKAKRLIHCSFIVKNTDVMARRGNISRFINNLLNTFWLRPVIRVKGEGMTVSRFFLGDEKKCYENYIKTTLSSAPHINKEFVFVTYTGLTEEELLWIEEQMKKRVQFEHIVFQKASAGITSNCGAGAFGILWMDECDRRYNLSSYLRDKTIDDEEDEEESYDKEEIDSAEFVDTAQGEEAENPESATEEKKWYESVPGLDAAAALKNSGSEAALLSVLKMYYDSYDVKSKEIRDYFETGDWENYTIKVHALKSSSRLVGALNLGDKAEALEKAGKASDIAYIKEHHEEVMSDYQTVRDGLESEFGLSDDRPMIPQDTLEEAYGAIAEFSSAMDYDCVKMVLDSVRDYSLPPADEVKFTAIKDHLAQMDWDAIKEVLLNE